MTKKIIRKIVLVSDLTEANKRQMFELFEMYYEHVDFKRFLSDLSEKTHVFFFHEMGTNRLVGFSTIFRKAIPEIAPGIFLFSGDTVIHADYQGSKALQKSFFWFILESKLSSPTQPVYWMLMSKGVKTYLMMRKNFKSSYPNYHGPTPSPHDHVLNSFYTRKFAKSFDEKTGLIIFDEKLGSVKSDSHFKQEKVPTDSEAKFFFEKNPQFDEGHELACVCEIKFSDFTFHIKKFFIPKLPKK